MRESPAHRAPAHRASRRPRAGPVRPALWGAGAVALVVFVATFVFPTRSFLAQRGEIASAQEQLAVLTQQNKALADEAAKLRDDAEIERLAREQYNLVRPGEEAYALLPTTGAAPAPVPAKPKDDHRNLLRKAWDAVTGRF